MCWKRRKTDVRKMEKIEQGERRGQFGLKPTKILFFGNIA
jgi:hypothetical protein